MTRNISSSKKLSIQQQQKTSVSYKSKYSPYQKFLNLIHTPLAYVFHLKKFQEFSEFEDYHQLLEIPDEQKTDLIQEFIELQEEKIIISNY